MSVDLTMAIAVDQFNVDTFSRLHLLIVTHHNAPAFVVSPWLGDESEGKPLVLLIGG